MVFFVEPWEGPRVRDTVGTPKATPRAESGGSVEDCPTELLPTPESHDSPHPHRSPEAHSPGTDSDHLGTPDL